MCTVLLPPGGNQIAANKIYHISYIKSYSHLVHLVRNFKFTGKIVSSFLSFICLYISVLFVFVIALRSASNDAETQRAAFSAVSDRQGGLS
jgi:hypothetical protein